MLALSVVVVSATEDPASNQMSEVPPPEEEFLEVAPLPPTRPRRGLHLPTLRNPEELRADTGGLGNREAGAGDFFSGITRARP